MRELLEAVLRMPKGNATAGNEMGMRRVRISRKHVFELKSKTNMYRAMVRAVTLLYRNDEPQAAVALILSYIEAMAGGGDQNCRDALVRDFPEMCKAVDPQTFYNAYRNGLLHLFAPKEKYALVRQYVTQGDYFCEIEIENHPTVLIGLNVDRFVQEFIALTEKKAQAAPSMGG